ncbi:MAG: ribosome-recycling factor [Patescibacteria group bacterium]|nr:MAG: ribosome-recycling factor [Patescibacteria group bacterium]
MSFDFSDVKQRLDKAIDHVSRDVASLRTGKATVQLLDPVVVEAYGSRMKIAELASVQAPDATLLVISPWDKSVLSNIERAIATSDLNLNPVVSGDVIRIQIAPLTQEKRMEMVKVLHKKIEGGRVMLRNLRTDAKKEVESRKGSEGVSEDDIKFDLQKLDELIKEYMGKLDTISAAKEKDLLTI